MTLKKRKKKVERGKKNAIRQSRQRDNNQKSKALLPNTGKHRRGSPVSAKAPDTRPGLQSGQIKAYKNGDLMCNSASRRSKPWLSFCKENAESPSDPDIHRLLPGDRAIPPGIFLSRSVSKNLTDSSEMFPVGKKTI